MSSEGKRWTQERFDAEGRQRPLADLWEEAASEVERLLAAIEEHRDLGYEPGKPGTVERAFARLRTRDAKLHAVLDEKETP